MNLPAPMVVMLVFQCATFGVLGGYFLATGHEKLGAAQLLLSGVQWLVYS